MGSTGRDAGRDVERGGRVGDTQRDRHEGWMQRQVKGLKEPSCGKRDKEKDRQADRQKCGEGDREAQRHGSRQSQA